MLGTVMGGLGGAPKWGAPKWGALKGQYWGGTCMGAPVWGGDWEAPMERAQMGGGGAAVQGWAQGSPGLRVSMGAQDWGYWIWGAWGWGTLGLGSPMGGWGWGSLGVGVSGAGDTYGCLEMAIPTHGRAQELGAPMGAQR